MLFTITIVFNIGDELHMTVKSMFYIKSTKKDSMVQIANKKGREKEMKKRHTFMQRPSCWKSCQSLQFPLQRHHRP